MVFFHMTFAMILTIIIVGFSPDNRSLDACLGNYEIHFDEIRGNKVCTLGTRIEKSICSGSVFIHFLLSSNILEAYLLYKCFQAIAKQTEKSAPMIGKKSYQIRKIDNGIVISISVIQWALEVLHTIFTFSYFIFFHGISNYADKFFGLYLIIFTVIIQPAFYLNGDATFRRKLAQQGFMPALKTIVFPTQSH